MKKVLIAIALAIPLFSSAKSLAQIYQQPNSGYLNPYQPYQRENPNYSPSPSGGYQSTPAPPKYNPNQFGPSGGSGGSGSCFGFNCR